MFTRAGVTLMPRDVTGHFSQQNGDSFRYCRGRQQSAFIETENSLLSLRE
jgi:hypothetical protein